MSRRIGGEVGGTGTHGPQARPGPRPGRERGGAVRQTAGSPLWTAFGPVRGRYARWMPTVITVPVRAHVFRGAAVPPGVPAGPAWLLPARTTADRDLAHC